MASRNLEYNKDNLSFDEAEGIVIREMEQNSDFESEVTGQDFNGSTTITSSMNVANVLRLDGVIRVELKGQEHVMDAIQKALDSQSNETGRKLPRDGATDREPLGGTGPNDRGFSPSDPPSAPDVGEDIDDDQDWYVTVGEDWDMKMRSEIEGEEPVSDMGEAVRGPFDSRAKAQEEASRISQAYEERDAEEIKDVLLDRFWAYDQDDWWLVDALTKDGRRGKMRMPEKLAKEARRFGYIKVVEEYVPDTRDDPMVEGPDYLREEGAESWQGIFDNLQKHPGTEPEVPSPMGDERVPMSQAEREGRMNVANYDDPQATADIYRNGVVSFNREGTVQTLDTVAGFFIDRENNEVSMGYVGEGVDIDENDVEEIVRSVRRSLRDHMDNDS